MWKIIVLALAAVCAVEAGIMTGGFQDTDTSDEGARNALNFAVRKHNDLSNSVFLSQVAEVVRIQRQVVAGYKYVITVKMGKTPCRKDNRADLCAIHQDPEQAMPYTCTFEVWSRPWDSFLKLLKQNC